jgi:hypothetical protein
MSRFLALGVLALSGCASGGVITTGQDFTMRVGQQVSLPDASTLGYTGIAHDSRCPPDVQCIRAGDADVLFEYSPRGGAATRVTLNTERLRTIRIGPWQLRLIDIAQGDAPRTTVRVDAGNVEAAP